MGKHVVALRELQHETYVFHDGLIRTSLVSFGKCTEPKPPSELFSMSSAWFQVLSKESDQRNEHDRKRNENDILYFDLGLEKVDGSVHRLFKLRHSGDQSFRRGSY